MKLLKNKKGYISIIFAVVISVLVFVFRNDLIKLQGFGFIGIFLLSVLGNATVILPMPVILTAFIAGGIWNPLLVGIVVSLGAAVGELTGYLVGLGSTEFVNDDKKIKKVRAWMKKHGLWALFILAAVPNPLFDLAGIVAGATKIPVYRYMIAVWAGKAVKFLLISYLGAGVFSWLKI
ncbi:VTT domain-containing protein [Patescibacteria group bacterium]